MRNTMFYTLPDGFAIRRRGITAVIVGDRDTTLVLGSGAVVPMSNEHGKALIGLMSNEPAQAAESPSQETPAFQDFMARYPKTSNRTLAWKAWRVINPVFDHQRAIDACVSLWKAEGKKPYHYPSAERFIAERMFSAFS